MTSDQATRPDTILDVDLEADVPCECMCNCQRGADLRVHRHHVNVGTAAAPVCGSKTGFVCIECHKTHVGVLVQKIWASLLMTNRPAVCLGCGATISHTDDVFVSVTTL